MLTPDHLRYALAFATGGLEAALNLEGYDSNHGKKVREWMVDNGLLDWDASRNRGTPATDKLLAWVEHLCAQPLPEAKWVVPPDRETVAALEAER